MTPQPAGPGYWMNETGGELQPAIKRYLEGVPLKIREVALIRAYLRQWIGSGVWDQNPSIDDDGRTELARLRYMALGITSRKEIDAWIAAAVDLGMDPL